METANLRQQYPGICIGDFPIDVVLYIECQRSRLHTAIVFDQWIDVLKSKFDHPLVFSILPGTDRTFDFKLCESLKYCKLFGNSADVGDRRSGTTYRLTNVTDAPLQFKLPKVAVVDCQGRPHCFRSVSWCQVAVFFPSWGH